MIGALEIMKTEEIRLSDFFFIKDEKFIGA